MTYSIWEVLGDGCTTLVAGTDQPLFADGSAQDPSAVKVFGFEAPSHELAVEIFEAFIRRRRRDQPGAGT